MIAFHVLQSIEIGAFSYCSLYFYQYNMQKKFIIIIIIRWFKLDSAGY